MLLGRGVYSFSEAATLTGLKQSRVREWFTARSTTQEGSLFQSDYYETQQKIISFLGLIDVFIAGQLREHGLSLQLVRKNYRALQLHFSSDHPFSHQELRTDGKRVFLRGLDEKGREEVMDVLTRQKAFPTIILPFLKKLDFDAASRLAVKWNISKGVVVNPQICFGQPVVEAIGIPTTILARAANANTIRAVANWYGVTPQQVKCAKQFEKKLKAA